MTFCVIVINFIHIHINMKLSSNLHNLKTNKYSRSFNFAEFYIHLKMSEDISICEIVFR